MCSKGVVYIVDQNYCDLLYISIQSLISNGGLDDSISITVFTFDMPECWRKRFHDLKSVRIIDAWKYDYSLNIPERPELRHRIFRAAVLEAYSPYDITLSLDADTIVVNPIKNVFSMLEVSECCLAGVSELGNDVESFFYWAFTNEERQDPNLRISLILNIDYPDCITHPYINGGVLCCKKGNWATTWRTMLERCLEYPKITDDQLPLQAALSLNNTPVLELSPSWNYHACSWEDQQRCLWTFTHQPETFTVQTKDGRSEPLYILHGIGAVNWAKPVLNFPANKLYIDYAMSVLYPHHYSKPTQMK